MQISREQAGQFATANPEVIQEGQKKMQELLARSSTDIDFRSKLLENPKEAIAEFTGQPVSDVVDVVFIENRGDATIVLPDFIDPENELSEDELEAVAGGEIGATASAIAAIVTSLVTVAQGVKTLGDDDAWTE